MADINLIIGDDGASLDWDDPATLADDATDDNDLSSYVLQLLCTDRVVPGDHYGVTDRHGSWHDVYVGEWGSLFWLALESNVWEPNTSRLAQVEAYAAQALQTVYDERLIRQPASISADWQTSDSISLSIDLIAANGTQRSLTYVL